MASEKKKGFFRRIYKRYIVVVYNESNLKERITVSLTPVNLILIVSTLIILTFLCTWLLITFTPMRDTIPFLNQQEAISMEDYLVQQNRLDSLEKEYSKLLEIKNSLDIMLRGDTAASAYLYGPGAPQYKGNGIFRFANWQQNGNKAGIGSADMPKILFPPVEGVISRRFSLVDDHFAVDLVTAADAPVKAIHDGYVVFSEWSAQTGNVIILQHPNNMLSVYKHNSVLLNKVGNFVQKGDVIALVGNSGEYTSGPHLHFELWREGIALDPEDYISF